MDKLANYSRVYYFAIGLLSALLGLGALILPKLFTFGMEQFIGWLFLFQAASQLFGLTEVHRRGEFWSFLLISLTQLFVGVFLILYPLEGIYSLSIWVLCQLLVTGLLQLFLAYQVFAQKRWEWILAGGVISWGAAFVLLTYWPLSAFWLLGLLTGFHLLTYGVSLIAFGMIGMQSEEVTKI